MAKPPKKQQKLRADFRKNRAARSRQGDLTRQFHSEDYAEDEHVHGERISGKGEVARRRTVFGEVIEDEDGAQVQPEVDASECLAGRVLRVGGLESHVRGANGRDYRCATRRLLKTLATDQRHVVATGDHVLFRPEGEDRGMILRVEPRKGVLSRGSRKRRHIIATNVHLLVIVTSAAEPRIKPNLIDRFLVTAEKAEITPIICINKVDLVERADLMPLSGVFGQLGYQVLLMSATEGWGVSRLQQLVAGKESVVAGQSGVGKSSILNAIDPDLALRVSRVSEESEKGRHTTTAAEMIPLAGGGYIVDTPGIRQFQLWDVLPEETAGFFRDIRPYVSHCRFPDCTHTHEEDCAVKDAAADGRIDMRRYESYCQILVGDEI